MLSVSYRAATMRILIAWMLCIFALAAHAADGDAVSAGKRLAFNPAKGNCLACHIMGDGEAGGDLGPPLLYMQERFPDRKVLADLISDPRVQNPDTIMPPYGAHGILNKDEIKAITDYVSSL